MIQCKTINARALSFHRSDIPYLSQDCCFLSSLTAVTSKNIIYPFNTCKAGSHFISLLGFAPRRILAQGKPGITKNGTKIQVPVHLSSPSEMQHMSPSAWKLWHPLMHVTDLHPNRFHKLNSLWEAGEKGRKRRKRRTWSLSPFQPKPFYVNCTILCRYKVQLIQTPDLSTK